ncbi:MAG TPA: Nif3-like dinuclear metal center hexameric protein [Gemmatimonadaceae bacterium]|nr:Nif3-like dinuclear metal center hexameric protein [Gemmatimonadaceae bacterium]
MAALAQVVSYLDTELRTAEIPDYPYALNGLQLANRGRVTHVAAAVDFSLVTIRGAVHHGANLLILHHGMFWGGLAPATGVRYERLAALLEHDIAVYGSHLPLDVHPRFGNNAILASQLGLAPSGGFAKHDRLDVGLRGTSNVETAALAAAMDRLARAHAGSLRTTPIEAGRMTRHWGMCTGAGASSATLQEAVELGLDTLIVGEGPHHTAVEARDLGIVVLYAGHYATETLGVRAIAEELGSRFALEVSFIDAPTGL